MTDAMIPSIETSSSANAPLEKIALETYVPPAKPSLVGLSREEIAEHVWDARYDPCSNVIDVYVQRLRRKLDRGPQSFIRTRRGAGYQLVGAHGDQD